MAHPYQKHREMHPGRSAVKRILKADGGDVSFVSPGHGSVAKQLADRAEVEKFGVDVDMRYGSDQISNPNEKPSKFLARNRLRPRKADGGMVEAKDRLAKGLKERSDYLNDPDVGIQELDRREATADAFASGDYSKGTYKPFTPKRGR